VLEAGGGSSTRVPLPSNASYTVIDISPEQLKRNSYADEKLLGDLQTFDYADRKFDVVILWNVLEHLANPKQVIGRLTATLSEGGLLIIAGPVVSSMKGLTTKFTPHFVHIWFYRNVLGKENAGKPGYAPFPSHLSFDADPNTLIAALRGKGLEIVFFSKGSTFHTTMFRKKHPLLYAGYSLISLMLRLVSFGRFGSSMSDFILVGRNNELGLFP
jgi:SAM-dependent methyltransferase